MEVNPGQISVCIFLSDIGLDDIEVVLPQDLALFLIGEELFEQN